MFQYVIYFQKNYVAIHQWYNLLSIAELEGQTLVLSCLRREEAVDASPAEVGKVWQTFRKIGNASNSDSAALPDLNCRASGIRTADGARRDGRGKCSCFNISSGFISKRGRGVKCNAPPQTCNLSGEVPSLIWRLAASTLSEGRPTQPDSAMSSE